MPDFSPQNVFEKVRNEPVLVTGFIQAVLGLLLAFGVNLSNEQVGSLMAVSAAMLAFIARGQVTSDRVLVEELQSINESKRNR